MRIALLHHDHGGDIATTRKLKELAAALAAVGGSADVIGGHRGLPDAPLRLRKIGDRPGRMPAAFAALARGDYDVAHAFTAEDAAAALAWRRIRGRPVAVSVCEPLRRDRLADRRLRLALLRLALERSDAVLAADDDVAVSVRRWMAVEPRVLPPDDAAAHLGLYAELLRS